MNFLQRNIRKILVFVFFMCIVCNYVVLVDIETNRYYTDFKWDRLRGRCVMAEFISVEKIESASSEQLFYYRGVLSNGKAVIIYHDRNMDEIVPGTTIKGQFVSIPEKLEYLLSEYENLEDMAFWYTGKNYYTVAAYYSIGKVNYIILAIGCVGLISSITLFLLRKFKLINKEILVSLIKKGPETAAKRDSNFELLRIFCIVMVIMQHFAYWGEFNLDRNIFIPFLTLNGEMYMSVISSARKITNNTIILQTIVNVGKIGVNCFMLITGYYMVKSEFKLKKALKLAATVWFYSWGFGLIFLMWNQYLFNWEYFFKTVFPILSGQYWFITIYLIVYALSPLLNSAAKNIEKGKFRGSLIFLYVIWTVIPTAASVGWNVTNTGWMILMYMTGAYFRLHFDECGQNKWKYMGGCILSYAALMILTIIMDFKGDLVVYQQSIAQKDDICIVISSLLLFLFFKNVKIGYSRIINTLGACSFGIYLIHENILVKKFLWTDWIKNNQYFNKDFFGLYAIAVIVLVYLSCACIEWLRQRAANVIKRQISAFAE